MRPIILSILLLVAGQAASDEQIISVQHDSQRGVTCWILNNTGISCLPDSTLQQATPSSEADRAFPANSMRESGPLVAAPLLRVQAALPLEQLQNHSTLAPEQDQDGPTPAAVQLQRQHKEVFQL